MDSLPDSMIATLIGLGGGVLLGLAGQMGRFCTLGAIEDAVYGNDYRRLRMWSLAVGLSIIGSFALMEAGFFSAADTIYAAHEWNPLSSILGGLLFGYGMAIAGNCGFGALKRLAGGDLKSLLIVIVMGISAYMTIGGPIGLLRIEILPAIERSSDLANYGYAHAAAQITGLSPLAIAMAVGLVFVCVALISRPFRTSPNHVVWSCLLYTSPSPRDS